MVPSPISKTLPFERGLQWVIEKYYSAPNQDQTQNVNSEGKRKKVYRTVHGPVHICRSVFLLHAALFIFTEYLKRGDAELSCEEFRLLLYAIAFHDCANQNDCYQDHERVPEEAHTKIFIMNMRGSGFPLDKIMQYAKAIQDKDALSLPRGLPEIVIRFCDQLEILRVIKYSKFDISQVEFYAMLTEQLESSVLAERALARSGLKYLQCLIDLWEDVTSSFYDNTCPIGQCELSESCYDATWQRVVVLALDFMDKSGYTVKQAGSITPLVFFTQIFPQFVAHTESRWLALSRVDEKDYQDRVEKAERSYQTTGLLLRVLIKRVADEVANATLPKPADTIATQRENYCNKRFREGGKKYSPASYIQSGARFCQFSHAGNKATGPGILLGTEDLIAGYKRNAFTDELFQASFTPWRTAGGKLLVGREAVVSKLTQMEQRRNGLSADDCLHYYGLALPHAEIITYYNLPDILCYMINLNHPLLLQHLAVLLVFIEMTQKILPIFGYDPQYGLKLLCGDQLSDISVLHNLHKKWCREATAASNAEFMRYFQREAMENPIASAMVDSHSIKHILNQIDNPQVEIAQVIMANKIIYKLTLAAQSFYLGVQNGYAYCYDPQTGESQEIASNHLRQVAIKFYENKISLFSRRVAKNLPLIRLSYAIAALELKLIKKPKKFFIAITVRHIPDALDTASKIIDSALYKHYERVNDTTESYRVYRLDAFIAEMEKFLLSLENHQILSVGNHQIMLVNEKDLLNSIKVITDIMAQDPAPNNSESLFKQWINTPLLLNLNYRQAQVLINICVKRRWSDAFSKIKEYFAASDGDEEEDEDEDDILSEVTDSKRIKNYILSKSVEFCEGPANQTLRSMK